MAYPSTANNLPANHVANQTITSANQNAVEVDENQLTLKVGTGASTPTSGMVLTGGVTAGTSSWAASGAIRNQFNVLDYGATVNGSAQQSFFQAANTAALAAGGGTIVIPQGGFGFTGTFTLGDASGSYSGVNLVGQSPQDSILYWDGATTGVLLKGDGLKNCDIGEFSIQNRTARVADAQTLTVTGGPTGTFLLLYNGASAATLSPTATAAQVQSAIEGIHRYIGIGQVQCTGGPLGTAPVTITLTGYLAGTTTLAFTIDRTALTGGTVAVARVTNGSQMRGAWLQRHTGFTGTETGSLIFNHMTASGFDIGVHVGTNVSQAGSEMLFNLLSAYNNGIAVKLEDTNSLDFTFVLAVLGGNGIGVCTFAGASNISMLGGSASGNTVADFYCAAGIGGQQGTVSLYNWRSENAKRVLIAHGNASAAGVLLSGCSLTQSSDGLTAPLIFMDAGRLTVAACQIDGPISARTNFGALSITLINNRIWDSVPFRVSTGNGDGYPDTIQYATYNVSQCGGDPAGLYPRFPDQVGCVLQNSNSLTPLWAATLETQTGLPNLYLGGGVGGWSAGSLYGGLHTALIPNPTINGGIVYQGVTGSTTYSYYIVANDANGNKTLPSPVVTVTNGFATLDATHQNVLQWPQPGSFSAVSYDVIRSVGGATTGSVALGLKALNFFDTGIVASPYTAPTRNATGDAIVDGYVDASVGFRAVEGANAKQGVATLVAGAVTVANTSITATSRIQLTPQSLGTVALPQALGVTARTAGTSFTITSGNATDTSVVAYEIFEVG